MNENYKIRLNWLKGMYIYTIIGAGGFGLGMLLVPEMIKSIFQWPVKEPIIWGITSCIYLSFGILSVPGLLFPLKFVPVLLMQLIYKSLWLLTIILPMLLEGQLPKYGVYLSLIMLTYVVGDIIAIPLPYIFSRKEV